MEENKRVSDEAWREEDVDFTYPDGLKDAARVLTMFPEEEREKMLLAIANSILFY